MSSSAYLNSVPLLASSVITWRSTVGVTPAEVAFDVTPADAEMLLSTPYALAGGLPVGQLTLSIDAGAGGGSWSPLFAIGSVPGPNPHVARVRVVDLRHWWPYRHVYRHFNIRRRMGVRRREFLDSDLQEAPAPEYTYAAFSTQDGRGKPWTAFQILARVLADLGANVELDPSLASIAAMPVEDLTLDHAGHEAVAAVLRYLPGVGITVTPEGRVKAFSRVSGEEMLTISAAGPEIVSAGHVSVAQRHPERPAYVRVWFTPEIEMRFDAIEEAKPESGSTAGSAAGSPNDPKDPPRIMRNVLIVPDFVLQMPAVGGKARRVVAGQIVPIDEYLPAITSTAGILKKLDFEAIRKAFLTQRGLWATLDVLGKVDPTGDAADWTARLGALQANYRVTYQLPAAWRDRLLSIRPYLVSTWDRVTGQRAAAMVFMDYCIVPSTKGLYRQSVTDQGLSFAINMTGYPGRDRPIRSTGADVTRPSPFRVVVVDEDQGVIQLQANLDPYKGEDEILPSKLLHVPTRNIRASNGGQPIGFDAVRDGQRVPQLSDDHRAAVLLTVVPATALYEVRVTPADIADLLPPGARGGLQAALGPPKTIRVAGGGAGTETARIAWDQRALPAIEYACMIRADVPPDPAQVADRLRPYCVNDAEQHRITVGAASLRSIARALAAQVYADYADRMQGSMAGMLGSDVRIAGSVEEIGYELAPDGSARNHYLLPAEIQRLDLLQYLPADTRRILSRQVK